VPAQDEVEDGRRCGLASVRADTAMMRGERRRQSWATGLTGRVGVGCGGCLAPAGEAGFGARVSYVSYCWAIHTGSVGLISKFGSFGSFRFPSVKYRIYLGISVPRSQEPIFSVSILFGSVFSILRFGIGFRYFVPRATPNLQNPAF
jgi:hypothetical protein